MIRSLPYLFCAFICVYVLPYQASAQFVDSINPNAGSETLFDVRYSPTGNPIGWYYTAPSSFSLDGIFGNFEQIGNDDDLVTGVLFS